MVSQGSRGGGAGEEEEEGEEEDARGGGGTLRVPGDLLFLSPGEAKAYFRKALEESDEDDGDDEGRGGDDKGKGGDTGDDKRGQEGGQEGSEKVGVTRKRTWGLRREVPGARMRPGSPPPRKRGSLRVATRERGARGLGD